MARHTVQRVQKSSGLPESFLTFTYRGVEFYRNANVSTGYYGRYRMGLRGFTYRKEVLDYIDKRLEGSEEA